MMNNQERLKRSEAASSAAHDHAEQAPDGELNRAICEALTAISTLRGVVREQQRQIDHLLAGLRRGGQQVAE